MDLLAAVRGGGQPHSNHSVSLLIAEVLIIILIVIAVITNVILHRIESWIGIRHRNLYVLVNIIYRELMILGLISFFFILYETINHPPPSVILSFEVAHLYIFLLAIFYTVVVSSAILISLRMSHRWKNMEALSHDQYRALENEHSTFLRLADAHANPFHKIYFWYCRNLFLLPRYFYVHEVVTFHDARATFINNRRLPPTFRFSNFLRKIKSVVFLDLVESHRSLHIILLLIVLSDILRRKVIKISDNRLDIFEFSMLTVLALLLSVMTHVLALKIRRVYLHMTTDPAVISEICHPADELSAMGSADTPRRLSAGRRRAFISLEPESGNEADNEDAAEILPKVGFQQRLSTFQAATVTELMQLADRDAASVMKSNDSKLRPSFRGAGARGLIVSPDQAPDLCRTAVVHSLDGYLFRDTQSQALEWASPQEQHMPPLESIRNDRMSTGDSDEIREIIELKAKETVTRNCESAIVPVFGPQDPQPASIGRTIDEDPMSHALDRSQLAQVKSGTSEGTEISSIPLELGGAHSLLHYITRTATHATRRPEPRAAEKYFWFGSHRLFLWCVEFVMFFSTVLLATSCTAMALMSLSGRAIRWTHVSTILAALANLLHMLVRIAGIIKKYIMVLHNGGLIPEITAMETIKRVRRKPERGELSSDSGSGSGEHIAPTSSGWRSRVPKKLRRNNAALRRRARSAGDVESNGLAMHLGSPATRATCRSYA